MTTHPTTNIVEALEDRIAPAGLVTAAYNPATGELTLTGDVDANTVDIFKTGLNSHRIFGTGGTLIDSPGNDFLDIGKLTKLTINGGDGNDRFNLSNLSLTSLAFNSGAGDDRLEATNLTVNGTVDVSGGTGSEIIDFLGAFTNITGEVKVTSSGAGAGDALDVDFRATNTTVGGKVTVAGGGGFDQLSTSGEGTAKFLKGIELNAGAGGGRVALNTYTTQVGKLVTGESILVNGGSGNDTVSVSGATAALAGGIRLIGAGANDMVTLNLEDGSLKIGKLPTGQSILLDGGDGDDRINIAAGNATLAGGLDLVGGEGANAINLNSVAGITRIGKLSTGESVRLTGGTGNDSVTLQSSTLVLAGGINITGGSGDNSLSIEGANAKAVIGKLAGGQSIVFGAGGGNDTVSTNVANLNLIGGLQLSLGDGNNNLGFTSTDGILKVGKLKTGQSILFIGGAGADRIEGEVANTTLLGGVEMLSGGGSNSITFDDDNVVKIGKFATGQSVKMLGVGDAGNSVFLGGILTAAGSVEVTGGSSTNTLDLDGRVSVGKNGTGASLLLVGGASTDRIDIQDIARLAGSVRLDGNGGNNTLDLTGIQDLVINGSAELFGGTGTDNVSVNAFKLLITGSLKLTGGGDGTDNFSVTADGSIGGDVIAELGGSAAGTQAVAFHSRTGQPGGLLLKGALSVNAVGAVGNDSFTLTNTAVAKVIDIQLGEGVSTVTINNLLANDELKITTNGGDDVVAIERQNLVGNSIIRKLATIQLGAGDDSLVVGTVFPTSANEGPADPTRVNFIGGLTADGGAGANDSANPIAAQNTFPTGVTSAISGFEVALLF